MTYEIHTTGQSDPVAEVDDDGRITWFTRDADEDVRAAVETPNPWLDELLNDIVRRDQHRRSEGQTGCPGQWDTHLTLNDEPCPYCGAAL